MKDGTFSFLSSNLSLLRLLVSGKAAKVGGGGMVVELGGSRMSTKSGKNVMHHFTVPLGYDVKYTEMFIRS